MRCPWLIPAVLAATPAFAAEDCYDRIVTATIAEQVPSVVPETDDGSIILRWPWFVDLAVERADHRRRRLSVISVQHTYFVADRPARWLLRRNTMGGYNARMKNEAPDAKRCRRDTPPARPYLGAENQAALDTLRREAERRYGKRD
jgi:hypothetical protein